MKLIAVESGLIMSILLFTNYFYRGKKDTLLHFKNQLYLYADMCHQNKKIIDTITSYFPVQAIISNLRCPTLAIEAKAGLTRILISLFMNSEKLMHLKKTNTQRVWEKNQVNTWRCPTYMKEEELEEIKAIINTYFKENNSAEDFSLHYEYLRLLSYLLNSDLILGKVTKKKEWQEN